MLGLAAHKLRTRGLGHVTLLQANGLQLPFPDNSFDAVVCCNLFHLIPNQQKPLFIAEMGRVLKPGGRMVVDFKSPFYGGMLALWRCSFRKRDRFSITSKCVFPSRFPGLFAGLQVTRRRGVKLPFSEQLEQVFGRGVVKRVNLWFGRIPVLRYLAYGILVEAQKAAAGQTVNTPTLVRS
jgi:ubiquinone/menaquinone biosynthesis C-methylase UbiE